MGDVADILKASLEPAYAAKVPSRKLPDWVVRTIALFDPGIRSVVAGLGKKRTISSAKAHSVLGWTQRPVKETLIDCGKSLITEGVV
jgi:dihydroflavonol-4-reductase